MNRIIISLICVIIRHVTSEERTAGTGMDPVPDSDCSIDELMHGNTDMHHNSTRMLKNSTSITFGCPPKHLMVISDVHYSVPGRGNICNRTRFLLALNKCTIYGPCILSRRKMPRLTLYHINIRYFCAPGSLYVIDIPTHVASDVRRVIPRHLTILRYSSVPGTVAKCTIRHPASNTFTPLSLFGLSFHDVSTNTQVSIRYVDLSGSNEDVNIPLTLLEAAHLPEDAKNITLTFKGSGKVVLLLKGPGIQNTTLFCTRFSTTSTTTTTDKTTASFSTQSPTKLSSQTHGLSSPFWSIQASKMSSITLLSSTPVAQNEEPNSGNKLASTVGLGVGIILAVLLIAALAVFLVFFIRKRKSNSRDEIYNTPLPNQVIRNHTYSQDVSPETKTSDRPASSDTYHAYHGVDYSQLTDSPNRTSRATSAGTEYAEIHESVAGGGKGNEQNKAKNKEPNYQEYELGNDYAECDSSGKVDGGKTREKSEPKYHGHDAGTGYAEYDDDIPGPLP